MINNTTIEEMYIVLYHSAGNVSHQKVTYNFSWLQSDTSKCA